MTASRRPTPPPRLERMLGRWIPDGAAGPGSVLGDLHEEYVEVHRARGRVAADLWYAAQVATLGVPWASASLSSAIAGTVSGLALDLKATLRGLRRHPILVLVGVCSLALGSGLVTAAATVVNGAWYAPLPWAHADRLVDLEDTHPTEVCRDCSPGTSRAAIATWRNELGGVFDRIEATDRFRGTLRAGDVPMEVFATAMTPGMRELLELDTRWGRFFDESDTGEADERVVVLTHGFWSRAFGEDPGAIGRQVELDGATHTVIGVLTEDARPLRLSDVIVPMRMVEPGSDLGDRGVQAVGLLADGVDVESADAALAAVSTPLYAAAAELEPGWSARAVPLREVLARSGAGAATSLAILTVCLIVLLVAALNLAALLLARVTQRSHELGVRSSLGAGRLRVARAAVLDAVVLATAGGVGGVFLTWLARDAVVASFAAELPPWVSFPIDLRVLGATIGSVVLASFVTGLLPLVRSLAVGRGIGTSAGVVRTSRSGRSRGQDLLLGAQIVLGLILVAGSVGAVRTFRTLSDFDRLGHRWSGLSNVVLSVGSVGETPGDRIARLADRLGSALDEHPALEGHAVSRSLFLGSWGTEDAASPVQVSGAAEPMPNDRVPRHSMAVSGGYFDLNEIRMLAGRGIADTDDAVSEPVAVVSEDAARAMWPNLALPEVVGESFTVTVGDTRGTYAVVGVAAPVIGRAWSEDGRTEPRIYLPLSQTDDGLFAASPESGVLLRADPRGAPLSPQAWATWVDRVAPEAAITSVAEVEDLLRESIRGIWLTGVILGALAGLVILLLVVGIYGTVSYRIASSRRDIGIRIALGADAGAVIRAVGTRLAHLFGVSVAIGIGLAWASDRLLASGGVPVGDADPRVLGAVAILMVAAAGLACAIPLRRALEIDPAGSLRME